jgi:hypothetical protein
MVAQMNLLKIFKKKTNYPPQQLPPKAVALIERLDTLMVEMSTSGKHFSILHIVINMMDQVKSVDRMLNIIPKMIEDEFMYMPRSISFVIDNNGTWHLFIGVYRQVEKAMDNNIVETMFIELLGKTNNARMEIEQYDKKDTV